MLSHSDDLGIPDELALLIGKIAIEWSFVEARLQLILASLIGKDVALGLSVTSNMGVKSIQDTLRSLAGGADAPIPTFGVQTPIILDEVSRLVAIRNALVHGHWERPNQSGLWPVIVTRFKGSLRNYIEVWSKPQIETVLADCGTLSAVLHQFMIDHEVYDDSEAYIELQASQGTQTAQRPAAPPAQSPKYKLLALPLQSSQE